METIAAAQLEVLRKCATSPPIDSGKGVSFSVASVITANVPSEPIRSLVRS